MNFLIGLLLIVAGLAGVFFGYRIFRVLLPIIGGIAGYLIAAALFPNSLLLAIVVGFAFAVVFAILAYAAWSVMITISGAILGGSLGAAIANGLNLWTWLGWILILALAVIGAILVWKIRDEVVIILTALTGAALVPDGLRTWFGAGTFKGILWTLIFLVLAIIGIVWQWGRYRNLKLLGAGGPAGKPGVQPAAAPVRAQTISAAGTAGAPVAAAPAAAATAGVAAAAVTTTKSAPPVEVAAPAVEAATPAAAVAAAAVAAKAATSGVETAAPAVEATAAEAAVSAHLKELEASLAGSDLANLREKVEYIEGIDATHAAKLGEIGIVTVMDLLRRGATRKGRAELVELTGFAAGLILTWINHADLFRVKGVGRQFGELLEAAGVDTVVELAQRNPANLLRRLTEVNAERKLSGRSPRQDEVNDWVAQAKGLPRVIEY